MGEKDIVEKTLFDYPDVVADVMNVLLFNGRKIMKPEEIVDVNVHSQYKIGEELHEETRDNLKGWRKNGKILAFIGTEQQTEDEKEEPIRIFGYDGAVYLGQVVRRRENNRKRRKKHLKAAPAHYVPVVTIVLHYGRRRWRHSTHLKELLEIPAELDPYVSDYVMNPAYDIPWLTEEQVQMFESDFRIVADYFVQMQKHHRYEPSVKEIMHVDAVLKQMTVLTKTEWRNEVIEEMKKEGKEITMVSAYAEVEKRGLEKGIEKGLQQGRAEGVIKGRAEGEIQGRKETALKMLKSNRFTLKDVAEFSGLSADEVMKLNGSVSE